MSDIEIIDGNDIQADIGSIMSRIKLAIARAQAYLEMGRPAHVKFTFNDSVTVTVAAKSDSDLIYNTAAMQCYRPNKSVLGEVGPYPADLVFEWDKSETYQLILDKECVSVWAYQLEQDGWVERVNETGDVFTNWYAFRTDWYVKDCNSARVIIVPNAEWLLCPCPSHK